MTSLADNDDIRARHQRRKRGRGRRHPAGPSECAHGGWLSRALRIRNSALAGLALSLAPAAARADGSAEQTSSLSWVRLDGAESCIVASKLAADIEANLGRRVFVTTADADLVVEGAIGPQDDGGFKATLRVANRAGEMLGRRELASDDPDCRSLDEQLALVISVMIDPDAQLRPVPPPKVIEPPPPEPRPTPEPPAPQPPPPLPPPQPVVVPPDDPPGPVLEWGIGAVGTAGLQPVLGYGGGTWLMVEWPERLAFVVEGYATGPTSASNDATARILVSTFWGSLGICPLTSGLVDMGPGPLTLRGCVAWFVGGSLGQGRGFSPSRSGIGVMHGPWLGPRLTIPVAEGVALASHGGLAVPIQRTQMVALDTEENEVLFETAPIAGWLSVGGAIQF